MRDLITVLLSLSIIFSPIVSHADEGPMDADGCHTESSKAHCHHPDEDENDFSLLDLDSTLTLTILGAVLLAGLVGFMLDGAEEKATDFEMGESDEEDLDDLSHLYVDWRPDEKAGFMGVRLSFWGAQWEEQTKSEEQSGEQSEEHEKTNCRLTMAYRGS